MLTTKIFNRKSTNISAIFHTIQFNLSKCQFLYRKNELVWRATATFYSTCGVKCAITVRFIAHTRWHILWYLDEWTDCGFAKHSSLKCIRTQLWINIPSRTYWTFYNNLFKKKITIIIVKQNCALYYCTIGNCKRSLHSPLHCLFSWWDLAKYILSPSIGLSGKRNILVFRHRHSDDHNFSWTKKSKMNGMSVNRRPFICISFAIRRKKKSAKIGKAQIA